jgi:hypothetical protein
VTVKVKSQPLRTTASDDAEACPRTETNGKTLSSLDPARREIAKRAKILMQGELCTLNAFPDPRETKFMASECIAEAVRWRLPAVGGEELDGKTKLYLIIYRPDQC